MRLESLRDALVHELCDLHSAETQLVQALPEMAEAASHPDVKHAFTVHLSETRGQVDRLARIMTMLGESPSDEKCEAMEGLITEGREVISEQGDPVVKDAVLIGAAQRIEHYEMAAYGTARAFAEQLGLDEVADMLQESLDEEGNANEMLNGIALGGFMRQGVNQEAAANPM